MRAEEHVNLHGLEYDAWLEAVDVEVEKRIFMSRSDMPDLVFVYDYFRDDVSPSDMAVELIEQWRQEGDLFGYSDGGDM